jgi:hypothetical protein
MIKTADIVRLKLDRDRLDAHIAMPPPRFSKKQLTAQIAAIGDAVLSRLIQVEPQIFQMQLDAARDFGVSYLLEDQNRKFVGLSAATSVIGDGDIMKKNLILPRELANVNPALSQHFVVGVFLRSPVQGQALDIDNVADHIEIAGWVNTKDIHRIKNPRTPPSFKSKLPVVMVPCTKLQPIEELEDRLVAYATAV